VRSELVLTEAELPMSVSLLEIAARVDQFLKGTSAVHDAMRRLTKTLREMQIPFAVAGAMVANAHGHKRTTSDVDILIRREDLRQFKDRYLGLGWVDKFEGSKNFRDTVTNVNIIALIVGEFPGDGLAKPVAFPEPESVAEFDAEGIPFLSLKALLELKLASGMTAPHRPRDLDDIIQLIRANRLPLEYAAELNPYVAEKFREMWYAAQVLEEY
jgi:hypothetical protein